MSKHYPNPLYNYPTTYIEACKDCKGYGVVYHDKLTDYHRREYETVKSECSYCKGSGRVKVTVTTVYEPFVETK